MELIAERRLELIGYAHKVCVDAHRPRSGDLPWGGLGKITLIDTREVPEGTYCGLCGVAIKPLKGVSRRG